VNETTPEQKTRIEIDKKLTAAGWVLQDKREFNPAASIGVAVREFHTDSGSVDYLLFVDRKPVGVVEAKKAEEGQNITVHEAQSRRYATSGIKWAVNGVHIRFAYEATDILTRFTDYGDNSARSRDVFSFHRPDTLLDWLADDNTLRNRVKSFPPFDCTGFRDCQTTAILNLEKSFANNKPRALIQMATGAGKTYAAITTVYRLLKFARAKRVLFLVDTKNLGAQAESEFRGYTPNDDRRLFTELYDVRRLSSSSIPSSAQVCISTIQRMYSILRGEELDESAEEENPNEHKTTGRPREARYNAKYPPEFFDFIIIDECHRSIYNIWQQVLDYFDAFQIGLTATPDKRTFGYFNENVVSEYTHEQAVLDNVNVGFDTYIIETEITKGGATILKQVVEKRDRLTRKKRWEMLDEDETYTGVQLDRDVVNKSQIRTVIRTFRDKLLTEIFPGRTEVPKTIIFAKTDSHADDIIQILREEFGVGNEFCRKITYGADKPETALSEFRNSYNPRIAVTVDMIATGTDVKPVECLLFMRDVRSRNYFEQMKGRGTRTLAEDDLQKVTPSANGNKSRFVIVDAVGVTQSLKTDSRPLERKPGVSLKDLMLNVVMGDNSEDTLTTLAGRLTRLDKQLTPAEQTKFTQTSGGISISDVAKSLLNAFDEDYIEKSEQTSEELAKAATEPFNNPKLRDFVETVRKAHEQIIDNTNLDTVNIAAWNGDYEVKAKEYIASFRKFIENNKNEITALSIFYSGAWRTRPVTYQMIQEVYEGMQKVGISAERLWSAYNIVRKGDVKAKSPINKLIDIVSLIRFELGQTAELKPYSVIVDFNFKKWVFEKNAGHGQFTDEQMKWLRWIKDFIAESMTITKEDLDLAPFVDHGGLGKFYELFGDKYEYLLDEMNLALAG
jgi:type I restriction enzyme R subunit